MRPNRRGRIVELLNKQQTDEKILAILDKEFPPGTFRSTNMAALYGTKYSLGKLEQIRPKPAEKPQEIKFSDRQELIKQLRQFQAKPVIDRYRKRDLDGKSPQDILTFAVDNTIYRAFHYETPSLRYSKWRWHKAPHTLVANLNALEKQEQFDQFAFDIGMSLVSDWGKTNERGRPTRMNIGVAMKITNLVLKHLAFSEHVQNIKVIGWLHVPWDSFTLKPLHSIWQGRPPIPRKPSQGFVRDLSMYHQLHLFLSEIAVEADIPRIHYEIYTWDLTH